MPRRPVLATSSVTGRSGAAWADRYVHPDGRRFNSPPLAWADEPSQGISSVKAARQNKGLHRTAHKLPNYAGLLRLHQSRSPTTAHVRCPVSPDVRHKTL